MVYDSAAASEDLSAYVLVESGESGDVAVYGLFLLVSTGVSPLVCLSVIRLLKLLIRMLLTKTRGIACCRWSCMSTLLCCVVLWLTWHLL